MLTTAELITKHWNDYSLDGHPLTMDFFYHDLGLWQWKTGILSANTCQKDPGLSTDCEMSPYYLLFKIFLVLLDSTTFEQPATTVTDKKIEGITGESFPPKHALDSNWIDNRQMGVSQNLS